MLKKRPIIFVVLILFIGNAYSQGLKRFHPGIHLGAGTDINLGLAVGLKADIFPFGITPNPIEVGIEIFYSNSTEESNNGFNDYYETTELFVIGAMANMLFGYSLDSPGFFYILGVGVSAVYAYWEEKSPTDTTLGEPYGATGSMQSVEGMTGGTVLNLGVGYAFARGFELRLEMPIIIFFGEYGSSSGIAPALTLMAGYRF